MSTHNGLSLCIHVVYHMEHFDIYGPFRSNLSMFDGSDDISPMKQTCIYVDLKMNRCNTFHKFLHGAGE